MNFNKLKIYNFILISYIHYLFGITCQRYCYCSILILFFVVSSDCGARITNPILNDDVSFVLFVGNSVLLE